MKNIDLEDRLWKKLFAEEDTEEEHEQNSSVHIQENKQHMTDYEKEHLRMLFEDMLESGENYSVLTILDPDWDVLNKREGLKHKTYAVSIRELK